MVAPPESVQLSPSMGGASSRVLAPPGLPLALDSILLVTVTQLRYLVLYFVEQLHTFQGAPDQWFWAPHEHGIMRRLCKVKKA